MNYKIKVTAENREAIKEIAERNGMNPKNFFFSPNNFYTIKNNVFEELMQPEDEINKQAYQELTFGQFKSMFETQETELDKWLRETKAKNLSLNKIVEELFDLGKSNYNEWIKLEGNNSLEKAEILYNQWNKEHEHQDYFEPKPEWQPKRGDRVLVKNHSGIEWQSVIFIDEIKNATRPIIHVVSDDAELFLKGEKFRITNSEAMKPIPITPIEPEKTFKDKVIELIENRIKGTNDYINTCINDKCYYDALKGDVCIEELNILLDTIKELN